MKRLIAVVLAITLALSLSACGEKGIELTVDNYETYLDVSCSRKLSGAEDFGIIVFGQPIGRSLYTQLDLDLSISGKSNNYDYNDVAVTVKVTGSYCPYSKEVLQADRELSLEDLKSADITLNATTDIVGEGRDSSTIYIPDGYYLLESGADDLSFEVVEVTGTMTPV